MVNYTNARTPISETLGNIYIDLRLAHNVNQWMGLVSIHGCSQHLHTHFLQGC